MTYSERLKDLQTRDYVAGVDEYRAKMVDLLTKLEPNWTSYQVNNVADKLALYERVSIKTAFLTR